MTRDEVMALSDPELRCLADNLAGGKGGILIPDYLNDIAAAWELWKIAGDNPVEERENRQFDTADSDWRLRSPQPEFREQGVLPFSEHSLAARCVQALCEVLSIDPIGLAYSDFGAVCYADLFRLICASPRDRTRAFVLAMSSQERKEADGRLT